MMGQLMGWHPSEQASMGSMGLGPLNEYNTKGAVDGGAEKETERAGTNCALFLSTLSLIPMLHGP